MIASVATAATLLAGLAPQPAGPVVASYNPSTRAEQAVADTVAATAPGLLTINPSATGYRLTSCAQVRARRYSCVVRLYFPDSASIDLAFTVKPELGRRRAHGRWLGRWTPTGRLAVTAITSAAFPAVP